MFALGGHHLRLWLWLSSGALPQPLLDARMVLLPKMDKVVDRRFPPGVRGLVPGLRFVLPSVGLRRGLILLSCMGLVATTSVAAASVLESFAPGFMATLDFSKCFDTFRPGASQLLVACGAFPLSSLPCVACFGHNIGFGSLGMATGSRPMTCGLAMPHGDPFGPLLSALWLSAGTCRVVTVVGGA